MTTKNVLGGLNYDAVLGSEDYKTYRDLLEKEILTRFYLSMGFPPNAAPHFGIVDLENPSSIASTETLRPLAVSVSSVNALQVSVAKGYAVTKSGAVVYCAENVFSQALERTQANDIVLIFLENELVSAGKQNVNDYMDSLYSQEMPSSVMLRTDLIENYNNASLYPEDRKNNIVVLAAVTVLQSSTGVLELSIDQTQNVYSYVRPWFSVVDIEHRSAVGTGTVSSTNPHGYSINDLDTAGNVNLFQGLVDTGMIVSRDMKLPKVLGALVCYESIPVSRIKTDSTGLVTAGSKYGRVGAKYCELLGFPTTIGSCYEANAKSNAISIDHLDKTHIVVFGPQEVLAKDLYVEYTQASALVPPTTWSTNLLTFGQPNTSELIVVGGKTQPSIPDPVMNFEGSGPFPRKYKVYLLSNRSLVAYPQTIFPATRLDVMGTTLVDVNTTLQFPSRLRVAMTRLDSISTMSVRLVIYGTNTSDDNITEYVTISSAAGYVDESIPSMNYDSSLQGSYTTSIFKTVTTVQVLDRVDDGPLGVVQIWGEIEQSTAEGLNDALIVAEVDWNGQGINKVKDLRLVSKGFYKQDDQSVRHDSEVLLNSVMLNSYLLATPTINKTSELLFSDDFENMKHLDTIRGFGAPTTASGKIIINNNSGITSGDTITLKTGKILTAMIGTPVAGTGQFAIGATVEDTKGNIMSAINNSVFASGCEAFLDSGTVIKVVLNSPTGSAANAIKMQVAVTNVGAIEVQGFSEAYDGFNECYFDRNEIGLSSENIPPVLGSTQYQYRKKYRSRAVSIPLDLGARTSFVLGCMGLKVEKPHSMRIKASFVSDPNVWTEWSEMTLIPYNKNLFKHDFLEAVHKIQVEIYGTLRGVALYTVEKSV